jgi:hypothetical protein
VGENMCIYEIALEEHQTSYTNVSVSNAKNMVKYRDNIEFLKSTAVFSMPMIVVEIPRRTA